jgi:hypothetical protein
MGRGRELAEAETPRLLSSTRKIVEREVDNETESDYKGFSVFVVSVEKSEEKSERLLEDIGDWGSEGSQIASGGCEGLL